MIQCAISATLRARRKTRAHLFCVNSALRCIPRENARLPGQGDAARRLPGGDHGGSGGGNEGPRPLAARPAALGGQSQGRRSSSKLPTLVEFMLARPIASAGMIAAALGVTPRAAQDMVAKLGLREMTGRGRYRAWGIL